MTLKGIISISGKSGLFKVIAQGKNNVIVESLADHKRFPAYATDRISALEDISIYTYNEDKSLVDIFETIFKKEDGKPCISHKEDPAKLSAYLLEILPDYDQERVYPSDIKKIYMWYNLLQAAGELKLEDEAEAPAEDGEKADDTKKTKEAKPKETKPKAAAKPKAAPKAGSAKPKTSAPKKVAAPKSGAGRGK
jgi:hypothetical protein